MRGGDIVRRVSAHRVGIAVAIVAALFVALAMVGCGTAPGVSTPTGLRPGTSATAPGNSSDALIGQAFRQHRSNVRVTGAGTVTRLLSDDTQGARHQRFILRLASGQTLLVAHNIDIAPRLSSLKVGDVVEFSGEYVYNASGGLVHWTHRDPSGAHAAGWLRVGGVTSQ
jgi:hypothetical protein